MPEPQRRSVVLVGRCRDGGGDAVAGVLSRYS